MTDNEKPEEQTTAKPANAASEEAAAAPENTLTKELEEAKKKYLYLAADFDNYRKQVIKERSELIKFGSEGILREMLGVLDNLERAAETEIKLETANESVASFKNGVNLIIEQFRKSLQKFGVEPIESQGAIFDPSQHEALSQEENPALPPNVVSRVFKKAYKLHGKLIRPAQVVVNIIKQ